MHKLPLCLLLLVLVMNTSFTFRAGDPIIVVGIASTNITCQNYTTYEHTTYQARYGKGGASSAAETQIKDDFKKKNQNDISFVSARLPFAVIIKYTVFPGSPSCPYKRYAVGFGNTADDARTHAIKRKNMAANAGSKTEYTEEQVIEVK
jgi:hypothetical protein